MIVTVDIGSSVPRVRIETTAATVYRVQDGVSVEVRGGVTAGVAYDYECPQETPVTYDDGLTVSGAVEVPDVGPWLIPVGSPDLGVRVFPSQGGVPAWSYPAGEDVVDIPGRKFPVVVSWRRGGARGSMSVTVTTSDARDALLSALNASGPSFLSSSRSSWPGLDGSRYVSLGDVSEDVVGSPFDPAWVFTFGVTIIDRPTYVVSTSLSWADEVGTWATAVGDWSTPGGA